MTHPGRPPITPEMKVGELLEAYPELEPRLIERVPAFEKLRNPVLRRTVAKVATLAQAAKVGGIDIRDLVAFLREAVGEGAAPERDAPKSDAPRPDARQSDAPQPDAPQPSDAVRAYDASTAPDGSGVPPAWFSPDAVSETIDAEAILARGDHPLGQVRRAAAALPAGRILRVTATFRPEPLIASLEASGFRCWTIEEARREWVTYILARP